MFCQRIEPSRPTQTRNIISQTFVKKYVMYLLVILRLKDGLRKELVTTLMLLISSVSRCFSLSKCLACFCSMIRTEHFYTKTSIFYKCRCIPNLQKEKQHSVGSAGRNRLYSRRCNKYFGPTSKNASAETACELRLGNNGIVPSTRKLTLNFNSLISLLS